MNIIDFVNVAFTVYTWLIFIRIILSWIRPRPNIVIKYIYELTEPFLGIFRRIIPPLGMIDISPIAAFFALGILRYLVINLLYAIII